MSTYYVRDGILYQRKTLCNLKTTWQKECIVYPSETRPCEEIGCFDGRAMRNSYLCRRHAWTSASPLIDWAAM